MNLSIKKIGTKLALLALCTSVGSISAQEAIAATLTIEYKVNIQSFTDYVSNTTTSYASPVRHGSISFNLADPVSYTTSYPVVASDPGLFTVTRFPAPARFTSPVSDLVDASYYVQQFGNTSTSLQAGRAQRASDNAWDGFDAQLSSGSAVGFVSSSYSQSLRLRKPWPTPAATEPNPYTISADALVDYLLGTWISGASLQFYEGFSVYDVLKLRHVDGFAYAGSAQLTNVLVDNGSARNSVPEPSTLLLCALGIAVLGWRSLTVKLRTG